ncbi:MAG: hypothetical protein LC122_02540 [Chitinophagales bacterium]|nr:hypothetical protein [Chitinophagales bacterium]
MKPILIIIAAIIVVIIYQSCFNDSPQKAMERNNFSNIKILHINEADPRDLGCGYITYSASYEVSAVENGTGKSINAIVCCSSFSCNVKTR